MTYKIWESSQEVRLFYQNPKRAILTAILSLENRANANAYPKKVVRPLQ